MALDSSGLLSLSRLSSVISRGSLDRGRGGWAGTGRLCPTDRHNRKRELDSTRLCYRAAGETFEGSVVDSTGPDPCPTAG